MKATSPLYSNAGFTLLESMLALAILSIGLLALGRLQISAIWGNALSRDMMTAVSIAEQKIEQLKNTPFANVQSESSTQVTVANRNFTRQVTVTDSSPLPNTKTVSVLVTWKDKAKTHTVPLTTIIAQPFGG